MNFYIMTLFPDMVTQVLNTSIIGKAAEKGLLSIEAVNIRDFTKNKHKKVDDYPYGGGAGMLMQAQPVYDAWESVSSRCKKPPRTVYLTPQGKTFTQPMAKELAKEEDLVLLCGHYEGIDERVLEEIVTDYVSIGDYVLTGGELPAMVMVDAISRMVPGVLTNEESGSTESFEGSLLEYPQYSRPEVWHEKPVPPVLLSGDQKIIRDWRRLEAERRTRERRPDMYECYAKLQECRELLRKQKLLHVDMTELIVRGQAKLVYADGGNICLKDMVSGVYFHTAEDAEGGKRGISAILQENGGAPELLVLHQSFMLEPVAELLGYTSVMTCRQAVYTRKEKLPITGLYRMDGAPAENGITIRQLTLENWELVCENYETMDDPQYVKERIEKGKMYGAFLKEELVAFAGIHAEGSIGMLQVLSPYQGRKIGKALETYMINISLEQGMTPYGQVKAGNDKSLRLQESLGLCLSRDMVYWMEAGD